MTDTNGVWLRYGGGSLTFNDAAGIRRKALKDVPFQTDEATAEKLMSGDPQVTAFEPEGEDSVDRSRSHQLPSLSELRARAKELGLKADGGKADLAARVAEAEAKKEKEAPLPDPTPPTELREVDADRPPNFDEATGERPPTPLSGPITMEDVSPGGKSNPA